MHAYKRHLEILWEDLPGATHCISSYSKIYLQHASHPENHIPMPDLLVVWIWNSWSLL